jgi:hypothetical protein
MLAVVSFYMRNEYIANLPTDIRVGMSLATSIRKARLSTLSLSVRRSVPISTFFTLGIGSIP